ncbi:MAG: hypothetical protein JXB00_02170 [Bacteroidales bacterium]|nr:hypothetical protein [Bacteroidales bacterium]
MEKPIDKPNKKPIEIIYIGLPDNLKNKVFWVEDNYRTNPLSTMSGGVVVVIEYCDGEVLGYDKIKQPIEYINAIDVFRKCYKGIQTLTKYGQTRVSVVFDNILFKTIVSEIYCGKFFKKNSVTFKKVWDHQSTDETPIIAIENYLKSNNISF